MFHVVKIDLKIALVLLLQKNHIFTSGASGTNAAVIRGALRAERPELLTVILPQSLKKQPPESQELLSKVRVQLFSHRSSFVALQNLSFTVSQESLLMENGGFCSVKFNVELK